MAAGSKGDQTSVFPAIFPRSLWRILRSSQARGMRNPSIVVRLYTWECLARTLKSSACWCPGGILISCPMLNSKLQNLPSKSENEPCHTVGETHFSHFHAQSLSFSHYPKLMSINEDWNTDLMLNRELSLPTQLSWTPQRSSTIPNYNAQHSHRLHNLRFLSPFTFGLFFFFKNWCQRLFRFTAHSVTVRLWLSKWENWFHQLSARGAPTPVYYQKNCLHRCNCEQINTVLLPFLYNQKLRGPSLDSSMEELGRFAKYYDNAKLK